MYKYKILQLYRLFAEAEQLEFRLLHAYYYAATRARHHRLLSICSRAHKRKHRRRAAYLAATRSKRQAQRDIQQEAKRHFIAPLPREGGRRRFADVVQWVTERLAEAEQVEGMYGRDD